MEIFFATLKMSFYDRIKNERFPVRSRYCCDTREAGGIGVLDGTLAVGIRRNKCRSGGLRDEGRISSEARLALALTLSAALYEIVPLYLFGSHIVAP